MNFLLTNDDGISAPGLQTLLECIEGLGQGFIFPSTVAFVSSCVDAHHMGAGMGCLGALRNVGKIIGPLAAGGLLIHMDYAEIFYLGAISALLVVLILLLWQRSDWKNLFPWTKLTHPS